ncbi:hypothetical protein KS4_20670 [Poriferisphaera corsica]|uniref:Uncharacterized protein n=2 Tax=Poriferisphaera corsica TaxID=2528020 RepID=A0A517YUW7_9BACT|nr:hypothetical protein KS4_20670 [Poriferisphaera corsica]
MVCECIPDDLGDAQQKYIWNIIDRIHFECEIHLLITASSALNLIQWQRLNNLASTLHILPRFTLSKLAHIKAAIANYDQDDNMVYCQNTKINKYLIRSFNFQVLYDPSDHQNRPEIQSESILASIQTHLNDRATDTTFKEDHMYLPDCNVPLHQAA